MQRTNRVNYLSDINILSERKYCSSYIILAVPMSKCLGKHSRKSYTFSIAILNCTYFFLLCESNFKWSAIKLFLLN